MKKEVRLYNVIFPIWLIWLFPQLLLFVIPGNLLIDCAVLLLTLLALKHQRKREVMKVLWWKFWLLGFTADLIGTMWMFLGWLLAVPFESFWYETLSYIMYNPFGHPAAFLWTLAGVTLAGYCIYRFDKWAMKQCVLLNGGEKHKIALAMAVITAPWLFFVPIY
ncbi:MAG: hypothetical protein HFF56_05770 [Lawsonibacter sp.]|nr:hypothetical protein [Lawsonibacter sp.]